MLQITKQDVKRKKEPSERKVKSMKKLESIANEVVEQMMNPEKNKYDEEIQLSEWIASESYKELLYKTYKGCSNKSKNDDNKNKERRENRLNTFEELIRKGEIKEAKENIIKAYHISLTKMSNTIESKYVCCKKTAMKIMKSAFNMIGYKIESVPEMLKEEMIELVKSWTKSKKVYMWNDNYESIWKYINDEQTIMLIYKTYLLAKKILLINSHSKEEYDEMKKQLEQNASLNAVYAAARALKN